MTAYSILADAVLLAHLLFVAFAVLGGGLLLLSPRWAWVHTPAVLWAVALLVAGWMCPLTPLEIALRERAGEGAYAGGFLDHYLVPLLYPPGLTRGIQIALAAILGTVNAAIYLWVFGESRDEPDPPRE